MKQDKASYKQIIKSTGIFGGSQVVNILIGFARAKVIAVLLGPTGVGLISIFQSIVDMVKSVASMGLDTSSVKDIASANAMGNAQLVNETVSIVRWWVKCTAMLGALICIVFSYPITIWAFGKEDIIPNLISVISLSLCLFFTMLGMGQISILQGLRRIPEMVKANVIGNFAALAVSIPLYWMFGLKGIIPSLILGSIVLFILATYYSRHCDIVKISVPAKIAYQKGKDMFKLGLFIVVSAICNTASMFIIRSYISHQLDLEAVGLFQSAWALTNVYLALILRSMGSDFFPRLCAVSTSNIRIRKLVNEQTHIVLLVSTPIIVAMLLASDIIFPILYTPKFADAAPLLRWQVLGTFFKVISWPMGFILLAKGRGRLFFLTEISFFIVYLALSFLLFDTYKIDAMGIAYFIAYIIYLTMLVVVTARMCNFKWRKRIFKLGALSMLAVALAFCIQHYWHNIFLGIGLFIIVSIGSVYSFNKVVKISEIIKSLLQKK